MFAAIGRILPTVLFVNDIHWIDERSEDLVDTLVRRTDLRGVLIICAFRPGYKPPWAEHDAVDEVSLGPLDQASADRLYRSRAGAEGEEIADIVERSGGNPLFIEELAANTGVLRDDVAQGDSSPIPSSLSGLLLQRVDRLSPKAQAFLRIASVIGRRFRIDLAMVSGVERDLALTDLKSSGLVIEEKGSAGSVRFNHALVQDAVYDSLLSSHRRDLHARVAHRLEDLYAGSESDVAEDLARHLEIAGESTAAARYSFVSGKKALEHFALRGAANWFDRCLSLLPAELETDDERLRTQAISNQIEIACWDARFDDMVSLADRELARVRAFGEDAHVSHTLSWLGEAYLHDGRFAESAAVLMEALAIGEKLDDASCIGHALAELTWLHSIVGTPDDRDGLETMIARLQALGRELDDRLLCTFVAYAQWAIASHDGRLSDSRAAAAQLIAYGEETGYPPANCWGRCMAAHAEALSGNPDEALRHCELAAGAAECAFDRLAVDFCRGMILQESGSARDALETLEQAWRSDHSVGSFFFGYATVPARGRALAKLGRAQESSTLFREAAERFRRIGHIRAAAMTMAAYGETLGQDMERAEEADAALRDAIDLASQTGMQGLLARSLAVRGVMARAAGQDGEANALFTEAKQIVSGLGWLALEQRINAAAVGLGDLGPE